jgi:hypothetical protein
MRIDIADMDTTGIIEEREKTLLPIKYHLLKDSDSLNVPPRFVKAQDGDDSLQLLDGAWNCSAGGMPSPLSSALFRRWWVECDAKRRSHESNLPDDVI